MSNKKQTRHALCIRPVFGKVSFCLSQLKKAATILRLLPFQQYTFESVLSYFPVKRVRQQLYSSRLLSFLLIVWISLITTACGENEAGREYFGTLSITLIVMAVIITFMMLYAKNKAKRFDKERPEAKPGESKNTADQGRPGTRI